jgi:Sulfotransferase family
MATFTQPIFPFVVGCSRSGTTLLRAMLDAHPELAVPPESHFAIQPRIRLRRDRWFGLWGIDAPDLRGLDVADAVRAVFAAYAAAQRKPRYADKTPHYVSHLPLLAQRFPEARFVHLIRDGRDVALSLLEVPWGPNTLEAAAVHWRRRVLEGRAAGLPPERYREVRYEALVAHAEAELRALAPWLGLAYDPAVLAYAGRSITVPYPEHHRHLGQPPTPGLRDWRRDMAPADVARFAAVAGDALAALGYDR